MNEPSSPGTTHAHHHGTVQPRGRNPKTGPLRQPLKAAAPEDSAAEAALQAAEAWLVRSHRAMHYLEWLRIVTERCSFLMVKNSLVTRLSMVKNSLLGLDKHWSWH